MKKKSIISLLIAFVMMFTIVLTACNKEVSLTNDMIQSISDQIYTGSAVTPEIVVKHGDKTLVKDTDYTVEFSDNTNVGTAKVTITGKGGYKDTATATFNIVAKSVASATITAIADQRHTGSAITPAVEVKDGSVVLVKDTDYTVAYSNNTNVGQATVTITGKGTYSGTKTANFNIVKEVVDLSAKLTTAGNTIFANYYNKLDANLVYDATLEQVGHFYVATDIVATDELASIKLNDEEFKKADARSISLGNNKWAVGFPVYRVVAGKLQLNSVTISAEAGASGSISLEVASKLVSLSTVEATKSISIDKANVSATDGATAVYDEAKGTVTITDAGARTMLNLPLAGEDVANEGQVYSRKVSNGSVSYGVTNFESVKTYAIYVAGYDQNGDKKLVEMDLGFVVVGVGAVGVSITSVGKNYVDVEADLIETNANIFDEYYNMPSSDATPTIDANDFFVQVAILTDADANATSIKLGDVDFTSANIKISLGNNHFAELPAFRITEGSEKWLELNAVILSAEAGVDGEIEVVVGDRTLNLKVVTGESTPALAITNGELGGQNNTTGEKVTAIAKTENGYKVTNGTNRTAVLLTISGTDADTQFFTKKVVDGVATYGLTKQEASGKFMFYPVGWGSELANSDIARKTDYTIVALGIGVVETEIEFFGADYVAPANN